MSEEDLVVPCYTQDDWVDSEDELQVRISRTVLPLAPEKDVLVDHQIVSCLYRHLRVVDLWSITTKQLQRLVEGELGISLRARKPFFRAEVKRFLRTCPDCPPGIRRCRLKPR